MRKRLDQILNIIMGTFVGVFIGYSVYVFWEHQARPELYAMRSAPWYTGILLYGAVTLLVLAAALVLKFLAKRFVKEGTDKN